MFRIFEVLKEHGLKVTPQRLAVYEVLKNTKEHPSAETIYNKLLPLYPTMSFATVYKTLQVLKDINLVQELNVGEGSFRYDAMVAHHPHITCLGCGKVDDVEDEMIFDLQDKVSSKTGYKLVRQQLYFYGYCPECRNKEEVQ